MKNLDYINSTRTFSQFKNFKFVVSHPDLLGGKLCIKGTRLSISHILNCLAVGMTQEDFLEAFDFDLTADIKTEVLQVAAEIAEEPQGALIA